MTTSYREATEKAASLQRTGNYGGAAVVWLYASTLTTEQSDIVVALSASAVCRTREGNFEAAREVYGELSGMALTTKESGTIARDIAELYRKMGQLEQAYNHINEALEHFKGDEFEFAVSMMYFGLLRGESGFPDEAQMTLERCDTILSGIGSSTSIEHRVQELYCKLHLAEYCYRSNMPIKARGVAVGALRVALKHESRAHQLRAFLLFLGKTPGVHFWNWLKERNA